MRSYKVWWTHTGMISCSIHWWNELFPECAFQHEMERMWKIVNHSHLCHPLWNACQRVKLHTHVSDLVDQFIVFCYPLTPVYSPSTQQNRDWHWPQQTHKKSWASPSKCQRTSVISENRVKSVSVFVCFFNEVQFIVSLNMALAIFQWLHTDPIEIVLIGSSVPPHGHTPVFSLCIELQMVLLRSHK